MVTIVEQLGSISIKRGADFVPHERQDVGEERAPLCGHKDQKVPEGAAAAATLADVADAARHPRPVRSQLPFQEIVG